MLEVGAGIGNITGRLMARRMRYVAGEKDPLHLHALQNRFLRTPNVEVRRIDPEAPADFGGLADFDTALCLNVLEYVAEPAETIRSLTGCLRPGGCLLMLVPQGPALMGSVDRGMGQKRRFRRSEVAQTPGRARPGDRNRLRVQQGRRALLVVLRARCSAAPESIS